MFYARQDSKAAEPDSFAIRVRNVSASAAQTAAQGVGSAAQTAAAGVSKGVKQGVYVTRVWAAPRLESAAEYTTATVAPKVSAALMGTASQVRPEEVSQKKSHSVLMWSALAGLLALRALQLAPSYAVSPENWRGATQYVVALTRPGDCVGFYPSDGRNAFRYYLHPGARVPRPVLPAAPFSSTRAYIEDYATFLPPQLHPLPQVCPRLWLVSSHEGQPGGTAGSRVNYARYLALRASLAADYPSRDVRSFGYAAPVTVQLFAR